MNDRFDDRSAGQRTVPHEKGVGDMPANAAGEASEDGLTDDLIRLATAHLEADPDSATAQDERLLQWQAAEERRRNEARDVEGTSRDRLSALARRIQGAASSTRLRVACRRGAPPLGEQGMIPYIDLGVAAGVGRDLWDEPCDSWIELPGEMSPGRYLGLAVSGDSMEPLMHTGDTILVRMGPEVQSDTVIVARHPENGYVVKRVERLTPTSIQLASLNSGYPPVSIPRDPSLIVGTVVMRWCAHGEERTRQGDVVPCP